MRITQKLHGSEFRVKCFSIKKNIDGCVYMYIKHMCIYAYIKYIFALLSHSK